MEDRPPPLPEPQAPEPTGIATPPAGEPSPDGAVEMRTADDASAAAASATGEARDGGEAHAHAPTDADIEVERLAAAVYGTIVAGSVMAAGAGHLSTTDTAIAVVVTVLVYWLAESYAHLLAVRVIGVSEARRAHAHRRLVNSWRLVTASFIPVAGMGVAAVLGADARNAVLVGLLCASALLAILGWWAARRSELRGMAVVVSTLGSGLLGLALIALKYVLH